MAVLVPFVQSTQLVGRPPLSNETMRQLDEDIKIVYGRYADQLDPSDYYII